MTARRSFASGRWLPVLLAVLIVTAALGGYLFGRSDGPLPTIESQTIDWRFRLRGPLPPSDLIVLVLVDDSSLEALGGWPLPREYLARALDRLRAAEARAVAIDLLFTERLAGNNPAGETALLRSIAEFDRVVLPMAFHFDPEERSAPPAGLQNSAFRLVRIPPGANQPMRFQPTGVLAPPERYLGRVAAGHVNLFPGADGKVRTARLAIPFGEYFYPALPVELARLGRGIERAEAGAVVGRGIRLGDQFVDTDDAFRAVINFHGNSGGFRRHSLSDLVDGRIPVERLRGRIVLIGAAAAGLGDSFASPYHEQLPGVALLATITDNIMNDRFLDAGPRAQTLDLAGIVGLGVILVLLIARRRYALAAGAASIFLFAWLAAAQAAFVSEGMLLNASIPAVAVLLLAGLSLLCLAGRERGGRRAAEAHGAALGRYVSPLAERHMARGGAVGEAIQAVVMFVDLRGFTGASESAAPGEVADRLRAFHRRVAQVVTRHGGLIDKYMGDGALVLFGAEGAGPREAAAALACARTLVDGPDAIGIGLHYGPLTIEEMGGAERAEVSLAGDTINIASRLQEMTKELAAPIVASGAVVEAARAADRSAAAGFETRGVHAIRGREGSLELWSWRAGA